MTFFSKAEFKHLKKILILLFLAASFFKSPSAQGQIASVFQSSYAFTMASISGLEQRSDSYTLGFDARWLSFQSRVLAFTGEFNYAKSALFNRAAYQQTKLGMQYYPFGLGINFEDNYESAILRYSSFFKPYVAGSFGLGRFLVRPIDSAAAAEISADYLVPGGALGSALQIGRNTALDMALDVGYALGNSTIAFTALLIRLRFGIMVAM